jgi:hypothetical protein
MPVTYISLDRSGMAEYYLAGDPWSVKFMTRLPVVKVTNELVGNLESHRFTPKM